MMRFWIASIPTVIVRLTNNRRRIITVIEEVADKNNDYEPKEYSYKSVLSHW